MAAASSSAKFFVHQNQNKANSSSGGFGAFATESSDVVELTKFATQEDENEIENVEKLAQSEKRLKNNHAINDNGTTKEAEVSDGQSRNNYSTAAAIRSATSISSSVPAKAVVEKGSVALATGVSSSSVAWDAGETGQLEFVDIEEEISKTTSIVSGNSGNNWGKQDSVPPGRPYQNNLVRDWSERERDPASAQEINNNFLDKKVLLVKQQHQQQQREFKKGSEQEGDQSEQSASRFTESTKESNSNNNDAITFGYPTQSTANNTKYGEQHIKQLHSQILRIPSSTSTSTSANLNVQHYQQSPSPSQTQSQSQLCVTAATTTPTALRDFVATTHQQQAATILNLRAPNRAMNSSQPTQAAPGNRITFTSQTLPNGTINIGGGHHGGATAGSTIISTSQLPNTTTIKTITSSGGPGGQHHGLPQSVQVQHHQVLQTAQQGQTAGQATQQNAQSGNQPIINSMIPASVVVGMRPPNAQQQQKNAQGNALGRVVIGGPHMVGTRPQSPAITLSTLTPGQAPALILKTENGFQLLRVGTATSGPVTQTIGTNSTNPTQIRLQTVPAAVSRFTGPPIALRKTIVRSSTSTTTTTTTTTQHHQQQQLKQQQATTTKQIKQNSMAATSSSSNSIVVNSVASTNSTPHVYTSQANISLQQQSSGIQQQQQQSHLQQQQQQQQHQIHQQTQHLHPQPQITQIQTISAQQSQQQAAAAAAAASQHQHQQQQQQQHSQQQQQQHQTNATVMNSSNNVASATTSTTTSTQQNTAAQGNTKEKCRKFLANLIDLSTREPKPVERNVRNLIQELVNANVEPEEFCERLERLLNASPQPCLIGFLKRSLPLLRQAMFTRELVIDGIKPPPQHVVGMATLPKIQAQIRPLISQNQTTTIGQTQVRMISPAAAGARPIGHTIITKPPSIRIQGPTNGPRLVNAQIRGSIPTSIQQQQPTNSQLQTAPTPTNIVHIRAPTTTQVSRPTTVQIRAAKGKNASTGGITHVKVGQTQIKAISSTSPIVATTNQPPSLTAISNHASHLSNSSTSSSSILSTINSVATYSSATGGISGSALPTPSLPTVQLPPSVLSNSTDAKIVELKTEKIIPAVSSVSKPSAKSSASSASKAASKKKKEQQDKDKDDKTTASGSTSTASSFFQQPSMSTSLYGDDDINDVAAMGGVNLAEESQRILGCTENIGTQIRSCKDEVFLHLPALQARIRAMVMERGLEDPSQDVAVLISHACQERLKNIVEKLAVIAEHRIDVIKLDPRYEVTKDVRGQIKFLEELDKAEQKRHEELERELLLRAAKSRSKIEDPEQAKMKARAKEMQRAEMEELRQRDANMTALQAIGPRKKLKLDGDITGTGVSTGMGGVLGASGAGAAPLRPRIKRINLRDMLFFMEQERETCRSQMLYKAYLK